MLNCKYTVDDVTGTNEGYAVTVIIEPLNMQGITSEIGRVLTENGGSRDEASVYNAIAQAMDNMASSPVYDDARSVVVRILPDENGQLSIDEDWDLIRDAMIIW